jgi:hypothetical protein
MSRSQQVVPKIEKLHASTRGALNSSRVTQRTTAAGILLDLALHGWRFRIFDLNPMRLNGSGSLAIFAAIRRASSLVSSLAAK